MRRAYSQAKITVLFDGVPIKGFMEGSPIVVRPKGGEVSVTEGLDGPGINIAARQGGEIDLNLRETSPSVAFLDSIRLSQEATGIGGVLVLRSGTDVVWSLIGAFVSLPGELATGDKKMGSSKYTITGEKLVGSNLANTLAGLL